MSDTNSQESRAEAYFDYAQEQFNALKSSRGDVVAQNLFLAGRKIRIEVASGVPERAILRALSHLIVPDSFEQDLTISAWDSESVGAERLRPAWSLEEWGAEGKIQGFNDARFHTAAQREPPILRMLDMKRNHAIHWTPDASKFPHWELGAPMRPLLHEWLSRQGLVPVHGGAVGREGGGILIGGEGGRGKSNTALACLNSDLLYASDDFCVLSQSPEWTVHSLYCTGKLAAKDLVRHPNLRGRESNPDRLDREKAVFFLHELFPQKLIRHMPVRAIVLPRVVGRGGSEIVPASSGAAQKAIAMSTIAMSPSSGKLIFSKFAELVRSLPCYELRVGADLSEVPALLDDLLKDLS